MEQYLTHMLDKGKIDPMKFLGDSKSKNGKNYFRISKEDIDRIFHLLGTEEISTILSLLMTKKVMTVGIQWHRGF